MTIPGRILGDPDDPNFEPVPAPALFGSAMRTGMLLLIAVLEETYPAQLGRYLGVQVSSVQRTLDILENEGIVATRKIVIRRVTLNPLYPAASELKALLLRIAEGYPEYAEIKESIRKRPRRRNKPL
jgi:DNA-binding transcriptional ArsR family regulator